MYKCTKCGRQYDNHGRFTARYTCSAQVGEIIHPRWVAMYTRPGATPMKTGIWAEADRSIVRTEIHTDPVWIDEQREIVRCGGEVVSASPAGTEMTLLFGGR